MVFASGVPSSAASTSSVIGPCTVCTSVMLRSFSASCSRSSKRERQFRMSRQPSWANVSATALPTPREAPVIIAVFMAFLS